MANKDTKDVNDWGQLISLHSLLDASHFSLIYLFRSILDPYDSPLSPCSLTPALCGLPRVIPLECSLARAPAISASFAALCRRVGSSRLSTGTSRASSGLAFCLLRSFAPSSFTSTPIMTQCRCCSCCCGVRHFSDRMRCSCLWRIESLATLNHDGLGYWLD